MNIYIIGLGLIGSSIARAVKKNNLKHKVFGFDENDDAVHFSLKENIIDEVFSIQDISDTHNSQSLIIIAASPIASADILKGLRELFNQNHVVITDVCSVKSHMLNALNGLDTPNLVLSHPLAGSHKSGVESGVEDLFDQKKVLISSVHSSNHALEIVESFWHALGAHTLRINAEDHDELLSATSHLPHVFVYALLQFLKDKGISNLSEVSGGGLKSLLRIGSSSPQMWSDIFLLNKKNVLQDIDALVSALGNLKTSINNDPQTLKNILQTLKAYKDNQT